MVKPRVPPIKSHRDYDVRPVPDPTVLTTQQLATAIANLKELFEQRLESMDKAVILLQSENEKVPARIDEKIGAIVGVTNERFNSIGVQFRERDARSNQESMNSKLAVDAALQAAKEAVAAQNIASATAISKAELAAIKQIDSQGILIQTATKALDDKINDIKDRLTRFEGSGEGKITAKSDSMASGQYVIAIIGIIIGTLIGAGGLIFSLLSR